MYHFFVSPGDIADRDIYIRGEDYNHIRNVLRMKPGEVISVSDGVSDNEYRCHIEGYDEGAVHCRLDFIKEADTELPVRVRLFQSLPKGDKMELIIQKAVELGVAEIIPVASARCVVKLDPKRARSRTERWNAIAGAAAKQSRRKIIPEVKEVMDLRAALRYAGDCDIRLIPYELAEDFEATKEQIASMRKGGEVAVFIGPEGGFAEEEIKAAEEAGVMPVTLGHRILRTETAAMVVLSWIVYETEGQGNSDT